MKITRSSDWRADLAFDTPVLVADIVAGEPARCTLCGLDSEPRPRTELWAVKKHHPTDPAGTARFYCSEHIPAAPAPAPVAAAAKSARSAPRTTARGRVPGASTVRTPRAQGAGEAAEIACPTCFLVVPPSGICGMCGEKVA